MDKRDVCIDGAFYLVDLAVAAKLSFLTQLNETLTRQLDKRAAPAPLVPLNGRWTVQRKAALLDAIGVGLVTDDQAASYFGVSAEELASWRRRWRASGLAGLAAGAAAGAPLGSADV